MHSEQETREEAHTNKLVYEMVEQQSTPGLGWAKDEPSIIPMVKQDLLAILPVRATASALSPARPLAVLGFASRLLMLLCALVQWIGEGYLDVVETFSLVKWLTFMGVAVALFHNVVL